MKSFFKPFILLTIIIGAILAFNYFNKVEQKTFSYSAVSGGQKDEIGKVVYSFLDKEADSDSDGLTDWEEQLFGTDLKNPDTDGDGFKDGEEIVSGRDPRKKSPDDKLEKISVKQQAVKDNKPETLTESAAKIIGSSLSQKDLKNKKPEEIAANFKIDEQNKDFQDYILSAGAEFALPEILDSDIIILEKENSESLKQYLENFLTAISENRDLGAKPDFEAINEVVENDNTEDLKQMIKYMEIVFKEIKKIPTPLKMKELHKENLSLILAEISVFKSIVDFSKDPLRGYLAIEQHQRLVELSNDLGKRMSEVIIEK